MRVQLARAAIYCDTVDEKSRGAERQYSGAAATTVLFSF